MISASFFKLHMTSKLIFVTLNSWLECTNEGDKFKSLCCNNNVMDMQFSIHRLINAKDMILKVAHWTKTLNGKFNQSEISVLRSDPELLMSPLPECKQKMWTRRTDPGSVLREHLYLLQAGLGHSHKGVEQCNWELRSPLSFVCPPSSPSFSSSSPSSRLMKMSLMKISSFFTSSCSSSTREERKAWT